MTTLTHALPHRLRRPRVSLLRYWQLYRERAQLAALDADALRDIGVSRRDAEHEAYRPAWDAPAHWRR